MAGMWARHSGRSSSELSPATMFSPTTSDITLRRVTSSLPDVTSRAHAMSRDQFIQCGSSDTDVCVIRFVDPVLDVRCVTFDFSVLGTA
jgi:hypothetical protein